MNIYGKIDMRFTTILHEYENPELEAEAVWQIFMVYKELGILVEEIIYPEFMNHPSLT